MVGGSLFSGGINNTGKISAANTGIDITAARFTGGLSNGGTILANGMFSATPVVAVLVGGSVFSGGINNTGKISAGPHPFSTGIDIIAARFSGGISNSGVIAGAAAGIEINTAHPVSIFDAGTIVGTGGTAIEFAGSGNTLTLGAGYTIIGTVDPSGNNAFQLGGTGSDTFDLSSIGGAQYLGLHHLRRSRRHLDRHRREHRPLESRRRHVADRKRR